MPFDCPSRAECKLHFIRASEAAERGELELVRMCVLKINQITQASHFPLRVTDAISDKCRHLELSAVIKRIGDLMLAARSHAERAEVELRDTMIRLAWQQASFCVAAKRYPAVEHQLREMEENVLRVRPSVVGSPEQHALEQALKPEIEIERIKNDVRTFKRRTSPVLMVKIGGSTFPTVDWSLGGLALRGFDPGLIPGGDVALEIHCPGDSTPYRDRARVVRVKPAKRTIHLRFPTRASVMLQVIHSVAHHERAAAM